MHKPNTFPGIQEPESTLRQHLKELKLDRRFAKKMASETISEEAAHVAKQVYLVPDLMVNDQNGRYVNLPENNQTEPTELIEAKGLETVGKGLFHQIKIAPIGKEDIPGVGKLRAYSTIKHADRAKVKGTYVILPGFGHTLIDPPKWFVDILCQIAQKKGLDILMYNPVGKGVKGFDHPQNKINDISPAQYYQDVNHAVTGLLEDEHKALGLKDKPLSVIIEGHSFGGFLEERLAHHIATEKSEKLQLSGLIGNDSVSPTRMRDFLSGTYFKAILPHVPETLLLSLKYILSGGMAKSKGKDFTMADLSRLFYSQWGDKLNCELGGSRLQKDSRWLFLLLTLINSNKDIYTETLEASRKSLEQGIGAHKIFDSDSQIFAGEYGDGVSGLVGGIEPILQETDTESHTQQGPHCAEFLPRPSQKVAYSVFSTRKRIFNLKGVNLPKIKVE